MDYGEVLGRLAPCGLDCHRCADFADGRIKHLSGELLQCLGKYGRLARFKAGLIPQFGSYSQFEVILTHFSGAACGGCRAADNRCPFNCKVSTCTKEKGIDFCFQCSDFPCDGGDPQGVTPVGERWKQMNHRMKEVGVVEFHLEQSKLPRY